MFVCFCVFVCVYILCVCFGVGYGVGVDVDFGVDVGVALSLVPFDVVRVFGLKVVGEWSSCIVEYRHIKNRTEKRRRRGMPPVYE